MEKHEHDPLYRPPMSELVAHVRDDHGPELESLAEQSGSLVAGHRKAHPGIWGEQPARERRANLTAEFRDADYHGALPCIEVAGIQVHAYVEDGYLNVSIDPERAESWMLRESDGEILVPVRVSCQGEDIWVTAPDGTPAVSMP